MQTYINKPKILKFPLFSKQKKILRSILFKIFYFIKYQIQKKFSTKMSKILCETFVVVIVLGYFLTYTRGHAFGN
jgi:hypothetical protein